MIDRKSIYIHIPYCKQVCYYCDFHFRVAMKDKTAMFAAMKKEIALRKDYLRESDSGNEKIPVETLYFGGGTPSVLTIDDLAGLLDAVTQYYTLVPDAEITLEANPDDLSDEYLEGLYHLGFNRLSIGIQSFFDDDLKWMNRRHNGHEAVRSVEAARRKGFHNINIDLIYGLPSMTPERWQENLVRTFALEVPHLSAYHLTIEPKTVFGRRQMKGETFAVKEDESVRQFEILLDATEKAGYEHYEISNFAKPGFYSRHNTAYWRQQRYIGIGPAAHSYDGLSRQWNVGNNSQYIRDLEECNAWSSPMWFEREQLSPSEKYNDYILVSLRTSWGADTRYIQVHFGRNFLAVFLLRSEPYIQSGHIEDRSGIFVLTRKGKLIADRIASDLFCDS